MTNALFQAEYADFKNVKTRGVVQLVFEIPFEQANGVMQMIGMPNYAEPEWFAIAKLAKPEQNSGSASQQAAAPEVSSKASPASPRPASYVQRAGALGKNPNFWAWADVLNQEDAAEKIRANCGVTSRRHIDGNTDAERAFDLMWNSFSHWDNYERKGSSGKSSAELHA